jgi:hypothetical protein
MQVAGDKAAAILGVGDRISSAGAGAETIGVVRVGAEVEMEVSVEARMATAEKIRRTGSIVRVFEKFKVKVGSFNKS